MGVRAVFFDLGGVIVRTEYQAPREHLAERLNMTYEDLSKLVFESETSRQASVGQMTTDEHWASIAHRLAQPASESRAIREEFFAGDVVDRDLVDHIRWLRPRYKTALLSNAWPDAREYVMQQQFGDAFDALIISAEVGVMKPDPGIFQVGLEQLGIAAGEAVFVDDTKVNVEAARALGMHAVLFRDTAQLTRELAAALE
jgi:putative hydrolase of the HAD superfamily